MAINRFMRATLKALSYPEILDKKNGYRLQRTMVNASHPHVLRPFYKIWDHEVWAGDHNIPVRVFSPDLSRTFPVLLFFHGGGWVTGNIDSYDKVCTDMARLTQHIVVSVDYQLAPEYKFPAAPEDCYLVARELFLHSDLFGITPDQITLIGDSAGGNLAAVVSLMARDRGEFLPERQILLYPATNNDHTENSPFESVRTNGKGYLLTSKRMVDYMALYRSSDEDLQNPYYAPILSKDLSRQPRTLIITAEYDPLRDEGEAYGHKLADFGNAVEIHRIHDALHGFMSLSPGFKHVKKAYRYINHFLEDQPTDFGEVISETEEAKAELTEQSDKEVNSLEQ
jgi:acetyl esterase